MAGAAELFDPTTGIETSEAAALATAARVQRAVARSQEFFNLNSSAILQTTGSDPDVLAGWIDDPTSPAVLSLPSKVPKRSTGCWFAGALPRQRPGGSALVRQSFWRQRCRTGGGGRRVDGPEDLWLSADGAGQCADGAVAVAIQ